MSDILAFEGEHRWLSNFEPCPVVLDGRSYVSVENAYQAAKTTDLSARRPFEECPAHVSKRKGYRLKLRDNWELIKIPIMLGLLRQKYRHLNFKKRLKDTGTGWLEEGNHHGDRFYGTVNRKGKNYLGRLIMFVREFPDEFPPIGPHDPVMLYSPSGRTLTLKPSLYSASAELGVSLTLLQVLLNTGSPIQGVTLWTEPSPLEFWTSLDSRKP